MSDPSTEISADTGVAAEVTDVNPAAPSTAEPEGVKNLLDTVNAVLEGSEKSPPSGEPGEDVSAKKPDGAVDPAKAGADPSDDELKLYSQNAQNRIREQIQRRKDAEGELTKVSQQVEQYRERAEKHDQLDAFLKQNRVSGEDFSNAVNIAAMIQTGRYEDAIKVVQPIFQELLNRTGRVIPEDLRQEVEAGYITQQRALELQQARMSNKNAQERERAEAEQRERDRAAREADSFERLYNSAAVSWENSKKTSDPDWSMKQQHLLDLVEVKLRRIAATDLSKAPRTDRDVHKFLDETLAEVEERIKPFRPKPAAKGHESGPPASAGARSKPTSLMDAVNQALGAS